MTRLEGADREAMQHLLLALADDEFVLGFWDSEWTGIAPMLEEDVAFSSIAQDEIGHAAVYYGLLAELNGGDPDRIAYGRQPEEYCHARLLDHARGDWAFSVARRYLYDFADSIRLVHLAECTWAPLSGLVKKVLREETYHRMHMDAWIERLATGSEDSYERTVAAFQALWPDALSIFSDSGAESRLVEAGILPAAWVDTQHEWLDALAPAFSDLELPFPFEPTGEETPAGDRRYRPSFEWDPGTGRTKHNDAFRTLWEEFTMVYRSDPEAAW